MRPHTTIMRTIAALVLIVSVISVATAGESAVLSRRAHSCRISSRSG